MKRRVRVWQRVAFGVLCCLGTAAFAQTVDLSRSVAASSAASVSACRVADIASERAPPGGAGMLMAICGKHGVRLGAATKYNATVNAASGTVLVVRQRGVKSETLLVSPIAGGTDVHIDNVTRELARLGGRAPELGLGDLSVDTSQFMVDGSIGVTGSGAAKRLDLKSYAARAALMTATAAPAPTASQAPTD